MEGAAGIVPRLTPDICQFPFPAQQIIPDPPMQEFLQSPIPMLVAIFAIMYFLLLRPQQQRAKQHKELVDNVRRGDTVVTAGGVIGRVVKVPQKDDPEITVEIADGVQVRVLRSTLSEVRAKGQPVDPKAEKKA